VTSKRSTRPTLAAVAKTYQAPIAKCRVPMDAAVVVELEELEDQLLQRQTDEAGDMAPSAETVALAERIAALAEQAEASEVEFVFRGIGNKPYLDLEAAHPPTPEQIQRFRDLRLGPLQFNPETFPPALLAASLESPTGATVELFVEIRETWANGPWQRLWQTCGRANQAVNDIPKSLLASVTLLASGTNSNGAHATASPAPSSSAGS
jgi:hypothetical protein